MGRAHASLVKAALVYARRGWPVFPLHTPTPRGCSCRTSTRASVGKYPCTPHGFKNATLDDVQISRWWQQWLRANIGVSTGTIKCKFLYHLAERVSKMSSTFRKLVFLHTGVSADQVHGFGRFNLQNSEMPCPSSAIRTVRSSCC
jgi:hypothetical protein